MKLTVCFDCGCEMPNAAETCPHCINVPTGRAYTRAERPSEISDRKEFLAGIRVLFRMWRRASNLSWLRQDVFKEVGGQHRQPEFRTKLSQFPAAAHTGELHVSRAENDRT